MRTCFSHIEKVPPPLLYNKMHWLDSSYLFSKKTQVESQRLRLPPNSSQVIFTKKQLI